MWVGIAIALVLALGGCADVRPGAATTPPPEEDVQSRPEPTAPPVLPEASVILVDGELVAAVPELQLGFPGSASGDLVALHVAIGQRVRKGDLIAVLDDTQLRQEVTRAQRDLERATEDKAKWEADAERAYRRELRDAEDRYRRESTDAERRYQRELEDARRALARAERDLERLRMQPPTTALTEARVNLARARDAEAQAADSYKQALDRPWEPQSVRDALYKEWQARIVDRELAELRLEDAETALRAHEMDVRTSRQEVAYARADLASVVRDEVTQDEVDKETNLSYDRAVEDARLKLAEAQADLEDARLYAPWDGLVREVHASIGTAVAAGAPVVTLLDVTHLYFCTENLSERHVAQLAPGQRATVTLRAYPDAQLTGAVEVVLPQTGNVAEGEARFAAYVRLDPSDLVLLPGMTGRVEIATVALSE